MSNNSNLFILSTVILVGACLYIPVDVYSVNSFNVGSHESRPSGVTFSNDGGKMFIVGFENNAVYEYSLSTPFSISSPTLVRSFDTNLSNSVILSDIIFSNNGSKMFALDLSGNTIYEYSLSIPFNVTSSTLNVSFLPSTTDSSPTGIRFSNDGEKMFVVGFGSNAVYEYSLLVPFNVTSSTFFNSTSINSQTTNTQGIAFSSNGTKMFILGSDTSTVYEYTLSTPFSVSSRTFISSISVLQENKFLTGIAFSNDGEKMFITGNPDTVYEYALPGPFDLVDTDPPTFTAQSNSPTQTTVTINEALNGTLRFTDWRFDGNVPTAVSGFSDGNTLSDVRLLVFTHDTTNDQTLDVAYTGNSLTDRSSNGLTTATVTATDGIIIPSIISITSNATTPGPLKIGDAITFTLTSGSTETGATVTGTYNSQSLVWSTANNGTTYTATYTVTEGESDQTTSLQITGVTITSSGNSTSLPFNGAFIAKTIDANSPKFSSAQTLSTSQIAITLNENVIYSAAVPTDFLLGGVINGTIGSIVSVSNNIITLSVTGATISDTSSLVITYVRTSGSFDDVARNSLQGFTRIVLNTLDTTAPIIMLEGDNPQTVELDEGYTELNATTNDGSPVTINNAEFTNAVGTYTIYYDSIDASNNAAIQINRTVNVVDNTPPGFSSAVLNEGTGIFTIMFNKTINVSVINSTGFSIRDSNASTDAVTLSSSELITAANGTTISFNMTLADRQSVIAFTTSILDIDDGAVQDIYANQFVAATDNPITTILDIIPPVISLLGDNPQTIVQGTGYTELNATTNDGSPVTINAAEFVDIVGIYSIYYSSADASGNAVQIVRTVIVVNATTPTHTSCTVSSSGDWIINDSCTLDSSAIAQGNVIVQNNSILSIPSGVTLDIDFTAFSLTVQFGSGVLIKSGGTIT